MTCHVSGRLYWATPDAEPHEWRLELHDSTGAVTQRLAVPSLFAPFPPPPMPSQAEATVCILTTLRQAYNGDIAQTIRVAHNGALPAYHFLATYPYSSSPS